MLKKWDNMGLREFILHNPNMHISTITDKSLTLSGTYHLCAGTTEHGDIDDDYKLKIEIPYNFPKQVPIVRETGNRISRDGNHHVNWSGIGVPDSLCLGARITALTEIAKEPTINGFAKSCIDPFLYSISLKKFVFGELAHENRGIFDDYKRMFGLVDDTQVIKTLCLICKKKRLANKFTCPCGCGKKLGKCSFHNCVNSVRKLSTKNDFINELKNLCDSLTPDNELIKFVKTCKIKQKRKHQQ